MSAAFIVASYLAVALGAGTLGYFIAVVMGTCSEEEYNNEKKESKD